MNANQSVLGGGAGGGSGGGGVIAGMGIRPTPDLYQQQQQQRRRRQQQQQQQQQSEVGGEEGDKMIITPHRRKRRVAVVTGVSRRAGIGHAVCATLLDCGFAVIGMDCRPLESSSFLPSRDGFYFCEADIRRQNEVHGAVRDGLTNLEEERYVRVVVNNAAISDPFMKIKAAAAGGELSLADGANDDDDDDDYEVDGEDEGAASGTEDAEITEAVTPDTDVVVLGGVDCLQAKGSDERGAGAGAGAGAGTGTDDAENDDDDLRLRTVTRRLDEFDSYIASNLRSAFLVTEVCRTFFPPRSNSKRTNDGNNHNNDDDDYDEEGEGEVRLGNDISIIHIGSTRAHQSERMSSEGYASAKAGLIGLMHSQGQSMAGRARVNVVSPGWIDTEDEGECIVTERDRRWHAAGRVGTPSDVAQLVAFLADGEKSGFVTCEEFVIDGGVSRRMYYPE